MISTMANILLQFFLLKEAFTCYMKINSMLIKRLQLIHQELILILIVFDINESISYFIHYSVMIKTFTYQLFFENELETPK